MRMQRSLAPLNLKEASRGLEAVLREKDEAIQNQAYQQAAELRDREVKLRERIAKLETGWQRDQGTEKPVVGEEDIAQIVSMWTGIPVMRIAQEESARLLEMESALHKRVIGQDEAIDTISRAVRRARAGLKDPKRPIGSFIFMGPTGVGKTELAKALAEFMFDDEHAMVRVDMSEFQEKHTVSRLIGAPPGYVGYEEGGYLTEAVRRRPYTVLLLDEIEKAHPEVFNVLLQIMDEGRLTDGRGRTVDFKNAVIIMTSNIGSQFITDSGDEAEMKRRVEEAMKAHFKPEFLNRVDDIIIFHRLSRKQLRQIVDIQMRDMARLLEDRGIGIILTGAAKDYLAGEGYDPAYGARPLKRLIQKQIQDVLALKLLQGEFREGQTIEVDETGGALVFHAAAMPETAPESVAARS